MKDNYELKNPRKNPYAERMKNGYTVIIERGTNSDDQKADWQNEIAAVMPDGIISKLPTI